MAGVAEAIAGAVDERHRAANVDRPVLFERHGDLARHSLRRTPVESLVAERSGRTTRNDVGDLVGGGVLGSDPRPLVWVEDFGRSRDAAPGVNAKFQIEG